MNDYAFGNRIHGLRKQAGLAQWQLARKLGVTDKAVSKWENGRAKPSTDTIRSLAALFGLSVDGLLDMKGAKNMIIRKIVVTGGPCAGKTTAMSRIQTAFTAMGWRVLFVPETATELISGGAAPWTCGSNLDYQKCQAKLQLYKEEIFGQAAATMNEDKILIVCDRGMMDNRAYMTSIEFASVCDYLGKSEVELRDSYDAVFHLVTAADGAAEYYTLDNNGARTETPEQAVALDRKIVAAWTGHPHLRIIGNDTDFDRKIKRLIREITAFLGEPEPCEIERRYLIKYPDLKALDALPNCRPVDIVQTYLKSDQGTELRVRQRGADGHYIYYMAEKTRLSGLKDIEKECRLSQDEYLARLMDADPARRPIRKTRYCLAENGTYCEIDIYPEWTDKAILEIELAGEDDVPVIPDRFTIIKEITDDPAYRNAALALI